MSYISDKLFDGYLRKNMAMMATKVKSREIVPHLSCLTLSDREEIEAKREISGNYVAMQKLLECLRRRENWPEELIAALEACEQTTMASEIRAEYDSLRGQNNSSPPPPPLPAPPPSLHSTVITAHVHPAPPANQPPPVPESGQATVASPVAEVPPEPEQTARCSDTPDAPDTPDAVVQPQAPIIPESSSEPASPSPLALVLPAPPAPSPSQEAARRQDTPPPQQEPEENSEYESDLPAAADDPGRIPDEVGDAVDLEVDPEVGTCVAEHENSEAVMCRPDSARASVSLESHASRCAASCHLTPESVSVIMTTTKLPVQESSPPAQRATVTLQPVELSDPGATQLTEDRPYRETACPPPPSPPPVGGIHAPNPPSVCFSKPGQLISIQQDDAIAVFPAEEPYSGNTDRLEMSDSESDTEPPGSGGTENLPTLIQEPPPVPCNQPEENHYEPLSEQGVLVNVVHVAEEEEAQNETGQIRRILASDEDAPEGPELGQIEVTHPEVMVQSASSVSPESFYHSGEVDWDESRGSEACPPEGPQALILNGQTSGSPAQEPVSAPLWGSAPPECGAVELRPGSTAPDQQQAKPETSASSLSPNAKYLLPAVAIGAGAMFMAWRLKN